MNEENKELFDNADEQDTFIPGSDEHQGTENFSENQNTGEGSEFSEQFKPVGETDDNVRENSNNEENSGEAVNYENAENQEQPPQQNFQSGDPYSYHYSYNPSPQPDGNQYNVPPSPQPQYTPSNKQYYSYPGWQQPPVNGQPPQNNGQSPQPDYGYYNNPPIFPPAPPAETVKGNKKGLRVFAFVLAVVVTAISFFSAGYLLSNNNDKSDSNKKSSSVSSKASEDSNKSGTSSFDISVNGSGSEETYTTEQVVQKVSKSVVSITIYTADGTSGAYASGIIMTEDGYVLTNDHIYSDIVAPQLLVTLSDGTEYKAEFVAGDSRSDLSIIKLQNASGLSPATFGSSSSLNIGEQVIAIGQSAGFSDTVTSGIISSKDRRVASEDGYNEKYLQTTAAINPGNSGGALVNMSGEVIGVTSAKIVDDTVEGICFAIPSDIAVDIVANMQENGSVKGRAKLGITYTAIDTVTAEVNDMPKGIYIASISEDSGLYGKGIEVGDIITEIDGEAISTSNQILDIIEAASAGDTINLKIYKAKTKETVNVSAVLTEFVGTTNYSTEASSGNKTNPYGDSSNSSSDEEDFLLPNNSSH